MLKEFAIDLHIHSALSPCAEEEMTPNNIVAVAKEIGLDIVAITDHNTAENAAAAVRAGDRLGLAVVPGMEVQTREEVHIVCLFASVPTALDWQETVYRSLPDQPNREEVFGPQLIIDDQNQVIGRLNRMLLTSTSLSVEQVVAGVSDLGGICIPSHVDRPAYSLIGSLGFIPPGLPIKTVEISRNITAEKAFAKFPMLDSYALIGSSDAHRLSEISGQRSAAFLAEPTFAELAMALRGERGRKVATW